MTLKEAKDWSILRWMYRLNCAYGEIETDDTGEKWINDIARMANNVIWLNDNSDYLNALWDILMQIDPSHEPEWGSESIEDGENVVNYKAWNTRPCLTNAEVNKICEEMENKVNELGLYDPIKGKLLNRSAIVNVLHAILETFARGLG